MTTELVPVYGLSPLRSRFLGGDYWDSEPQLVALLRCPDGKLRVLPVTSFGSPKPPEEVFPTNDLDGVLSRLNPVLASSISVIVPGDDGKTRRDRVQVIEREDGLYAVYKRNSDDPNFEGELYELAQEETPRHVPSHPKAIPGRVFEVHKDGEKHVTTEEREVPAPSQYEGETFTEEFISNVEYDRETTYFAAELRLFSVNGKRGKRGETPNDGLAQNTIKRVADQFNVPDEFVETRTRKWVGGKPDTIPCPSLEYMVEKEKCECREYKKNKPGYTGTVIERIDKYVKHRCPDCGGVFLRRNKRELADGMY